VAFHTETIYFFSYKTTYLNGEVICTVLSLPLRLIFPVQRFPARLNPGLVYALYFQPGISKSWKISPRAVFTKLHFYIT